jgi:hypothetical protein
VVFIVSMRMCVNFILVSNERGRLSRYPFWLMLLSFELRAKHAPGEKR